MQPQATGEVINEKLLAKAVPQLYQKSSVQSIDVPYTKVSGGKEKRILNIKDKVMREEMLNRGYAK